MIELIKNFAVSTGLGLGLFVAGNLYLAAVSNASPTLIQMDKQLRSLARRVPRSAVFSSRRGSITGLAYDSGKDEEVEFYRAAVRLPFIWLVPWSGSNRSGVVVARRASADVVFRVVLMFAVVVPSLILLAWLGFTRHWIWFLLLVVVLVHQFVVWLIKRSVWIKPGPFFAFALLIFLERMSWVPLPWTASLVILTVWMMYTYGIIVWVARSDI